MSAIEIEPFEESSVAKTSLAVDRPSSYQVSDKPLLPPVSTRTASDKRTLEEILKERRAEAKNYLYDRSVKEIPTIKESANMKPVKDLYGERIRQTAPSIGFDENRLWSLLFGESFMNIYRSMVSLEEFEKVMLTTPDKFFAKFPFLKRAYIIREEFFASTPEGHILKTLGNLFKTNYTKVFADLTAIAERHIQRFHYRYTLNEMAVRHMNYRGMFVDKEVSLNGLSKFLNDVLHSSVTGIEVCWVEHCYAFLIPHDIKYGKVFKELEAYITNYLTTPNESGGDLC